jgi:hypothetical protein
MVACFEMFTEALVQLLGRNDPLEIRREIEFVDGMIRRAVQLQRWVSFWNLLRFPIRRDDVAIFVSNDGHLHGHISQSLWNSGK